MDPLKIFIGYDIRELPAFYTLAHSLVKHSTMPLSIVPLNKRHFPTVYRREDGLGSTEFSLSRFLVPYFTGYNGLSLFMDCDMLCRSDISRLFARVSPYKAVHLVTHDYEPATERKMLDQPQYRYPRKNWSSLMLFNGPMCRDLTPDTVNNSTGMYLHQFKWLVDREIGELDPTWNWLVGEYPYRPDAKVVHFTLGGPWWRGFENVDYADEWRATHDEVTRANTGVRA